VLGVPAVFRFLLHRFVRRVVRLVEVLHEQRNQATPADELFWCEGLATLLAARSTR
jgi:hypothetical protein